MEMVSNESQAATLPDELKDLEDALVIPFITNDNHDSMQKFDVEVTSRSDVQLLEQVNWAMMFFRQQQKLDTPV